MRTIAFWSAAILLIVVTFSGCTKDDSNNPNGTNELPYKPSVYITGPTTGATNNVYNFQIHGWKPGYVYIFDWGDGTIKEEAGYGAYGGPEYVSHAWANAGTYLIRIKEKDAYTYKESQWTDPFTITISDNTFTKLYIDKESSSNSLNGDFVFTTSDGGYLIVGTQMVQSYMYQDLNIIFLKTDNTGDEQWRKIIGEPNREEAPLSCIMQDGELIILTRIGFYKVNLNGDVLFFKEMPYNIGYGCNIQKSADGNFFIYGWYYNSSAYADYPFISKFNASFDPVWFTELNLGSAYLIVQSLIEEADGSLYAWTTHQRLVKLDKNGNQLWVKSFFPSSGDNSNQGCLIKAPDGNFAVVTLMWDGQYGDANYGIRVIKIDKEGNKLSDRFAGKMMNMYAYTTTKDNAIVVGGWKYSPLPNSDFSAYLCYFKISFEGDLIWSQEYYQNPPGFFRASAYDITVAPDNGLVITGYLTGINTGHGMFLMKTDALGNATLPPPQKSSP